MKSFATLLTLTLLSAAVLAEEALAKKECRKEYTDCLANAYSSLGPMPGGQYLYQNHLRACEVEQVECLKKNADQESQPAGADKTQKPAG